MNGITKENTKLLKSYHDRLIKKFERYIAETQKENADRPCRDDAPMGMDDYLAYPADFKALLRDVKEENENTEVRLAKVASPTGEREDFGYLLVVLSRIVPLVDKVVKRICDMNIGDSVVTEENRIQAMQSAMVWLHLRATDSRELIFQDVSRLSRFIRFQILRYMRHNGCAITPETVKMRNEEMSAAVWGSGGEYTREKRLGWLKKFKADEESLLEETFACFEELHAYYDYMKRVTEKDFLDSFETTEKKSEYHFAAIRMLAVNVQNIILRRFSSYVKISDLNLPHGNFGYADFTSSTLSDSNFISGDFHFADFSDAVVKSSDLSVSDLTFVYAAKADFTDTNMNSSNLIGADFTSATLTNVQLMKALFRDAAVDYAPSRVPPPLMPKNRQSARTLREDFFEKLARDSGNTDGDKRTVWSCTTDSPVNMEIRFVGALDEAKRILAEKWSAVDASYRFKVITPEELRKAREADGSQVSYEQSTSSTTVFKDSTMKGAQLPQADLSHADLSTCSLDKADVNEADLYYTNLTGSTLIGANFSNSSFYRSRMESTNFQEVNLINSSLICCDLRNASFNKAIMIGTTILNDGLKKSDLGETECYEGDAKNKPSYRGEIFLDSLLKAEEGASFRTQTSDRSLEAEVSLMDCNFNSAIGTGLVVSGMNADRSTWIKAELKKAILFNMIARWGQFTGADLSYAILVGVSLYQASAESLNMPNSRLFACDLTGTKLRDANMIGSRIERTIFRNADMKGINLSRALIRNCVISDVSLIGANLGDAIFENVIFEEVDLTGCIGLSTAAFKHCCFGVGCVGLQYQKGADGKKDPTFMSISHHGSRVKFLQDVSDEGNEAESTEERNDRASFRWYTSLTYLLNNN